MASRRVRQAEPDAACDCVIDYLLKHSFSTLTLYEKQKMVRGSIERPANTRLDHINWLCSCPTSKKFYCWPCLLFSKDMQKWCGDAEEVERTHSRHKQSSGHLIAMKKLKLFGKTQPFTSRDNFFYTTIEKQNENVRHNRHLLKYLFKSICFLVKQDLSVETHCTGLLREFSEFDNDLKNHLESHAVFAQFSLTSNHIQKKAVIATMTILAERIKSEVEDANFVSLVLDETDTGFESHLAVVLRYFTNSGCLAERLLGVASIDKTDGCLYQATSHIMQQLELGDKVVSVSYDGAPVVTNEHKNLKMKLRESHKNALFVHCYGHKLNFVLTQVLSNIKECNVFFKALASFARFFTIGNATLDKELKNMFPCLAPTRWKFSKRLVETIQDKRPQLEALFEKIIGDTESWGSEISCLAQSLLLYLRCFHFNFLLVVFTFVFPHTHILSQVLQKKIFDVDMCVRKINDLRNYLLKLHDNFDSVWGRLDANGEKKLWLNQNMDKNKYAALFHKIIDTICCHIFERYGEIDKFRFLSLLNEKQFDKYSTTFPESAFRSLKDNYGDLFDLLTLRNELDVVYNDTDFRNRSVQEIYEYLRGLQLDEVFPQTYQLCKLVLTIPAASILSGPYTIIKCIKRYFLNGKTADLAPLYVEKELLYSLSKSPRFTDDVINVFAGHNMEFDLTYQSCPAERSS